jgi:peptidoglycan/LPS O-acetylase OafA/YrhL
MSVARACAADGMITRMKRWARDRIGVDSTPFPGDGAVGVQLFFILSAFLLLQAWIKADYGQAHSVNIRRYFGHRLFRILPGYYCCLFFMLFFVPTFIPANDIYSRVGLRDVSIHLLFMQHLFPSPHRPGSTTRSER